MKSDLASLFAPNGCVWGGFIKQLSYSMQFIVIELRPAAAAIH